MKLFFDTNLSYKLPKILSDIFPESIHAEDVFLDEEDDKKIWDYAREHNFIIVSKDHDFLDMSVLYNSPPKLIFLKIGNCSTDKVAQTLRMNFEFIQTLIDSPKLDHLILY